MYPETASFPAGTWGANTREQTRSMYSACERGSRRVCDPGTRNDNRGYSRDGVSFRRPREDREVDYGG